MKTESQKLADVRTLAANADDMMVRAFEALGKTSIPGSKEGREILATLAEVRWILERIRSA